MPDKMNDKADHDSTGKPRSTNIEDHPLGNGPLDSLNQFN